MDDINKKELNEIDICDLFITPAIKFADYVLYRESGVPVAMVEAKDNTHSVSQAMQQTLGYAHILELPSDFSSNGDAFATHNKVPFPKKRLKPNSNWPTP